MAAFSTIILVALSDRLQFSGKNVSYEDLYKNKFGLSDGSIRVTIQRLFDRGFVQKIIKNGRTYLRLTSAGEKELTTLFDPKERERWDGKWRVALIDKEKNFEKSGFGMLQKGVYISPFPVKDMSSVIVLETKQLGFLGYREAAEEAWGLSKLKNRFEAWFSHANSFRGGMREFASLIFQYEDIVSRVPRLPCELFPQDWPEERARKKCIKLIEKYF